LGTLAAVTHWTEKDFSLVGLAEVGNIVFKSFAVLVGGRSRPDFLGLGLVGLLKQLDLELGVGLEGRAGLGLDGFGNCRPRDRLDVLLAGSHDAIFDGIFDDAFRDWLLDTV
jgi:hypothetical protein